MRFRRYGVSGPVGPHEIKALEDESGLVAVLGAGPAIVDLRNADLGQASMASLYFLAEGWARKALGYSVAVLVKNHCRRARFFELCCRNRGVPVRVFVADAEAGSWLETQSKLRHNCRKAG